jgi:hypothetical protein
MKTLVFLALALTWCLLGCVKSAPEKIKIVARAAAVLPDSSLAKTSSEPEYVFQVALINTRPANENNWPKVWFDTVRIELSNGRSKSTVYVGPLIMFEIPIEPSDSNVFEFRESNFSQSRWFFENNQDSLLYLRIYVNTVNCYERPESKYRRVYVEGAEAEFIVPFPSRLPYSDSLSDHTAYQKLKRK